MRGFELDLFRIFFRLDLDETVQRLLDGLRHVRQRFHFLAVDLGHGEIGDVIVADRAIRRKDLSQDHDPAVSFRIKLRLKSVFVDEALRRVLQPVRAPFPEILAGQLLKNQPAQDVIERRPIDRVGRNHVVVGGAMLERKVQLHRLALALDLERHGVAAKARPVIRLRELDFPVERVDVIPILIDLVVPDADHNIADF